MKKQITILFLIFGMYACAMPKYLEQLPDESLIKQLYTQQKANTTDAELLEDLKDLDDAIKTLIDAKHQYNASFAEAAPWIGLWAQVLVNSRVKNHPVKDLAKREKTFLLNLLENELKLEQKNGTDSVAI